MKIRLETSWVTESQIEAPNGLSRLELVKWLEANLDDMLLHELERLGKAGCMVQQATIEAIDVETEQEIWSW